MTTLSGFAATSLAAAAIAVITGCAGGAGSGPPAEAPAYRVGDRWLYHGADGFRVKLEWDETHEVAAIAPDGITARITAKGLTPNVARTELWSAPGLVKVGSICGDNQTRRFAVVLQRDNFPLATGKTWSQFVDNYNEATKESGQVNHWVHVNGWEKVATPAGVFDAISLQVLMRLDDETFWRYATTCNYTMWYAPAVRGIVREERRAQYVEKSSGSAGGGGTIRTQYGTVELVSFTPGG